MKIEDFIEETISYGISCLHCYATYNDEPKKDPLIKLVESYGWRVIGNEVYCRDCAIKYNRHECQECNLTCDCTDEPCLHCG